MVLLRWRDTILLTSQIPLPYNINSQVLKYTPSFKIFACGALYLPLYLPINISSKPLYFSKDSKRKLLSYAHS